MLRVSIADAKVHMKLAMPVLHPRQHGQVLLKSGYKLEIETILRMRQLGVRFVWVDYPGLEYLSQYVDEKVLEARQDVMQQVTDAFESVQEGSLARLPFGRYTEAIGQLIATLLENPKAALLLDGLDTAGGDELMRHSSAVTYLSVLMGLKLEGYLVRQRRRLNPDRAREVNDLGVGAMLHDIGVTQLDQQVRLKRLETGDDHDPQWRQHPLIGYKMVRGQISPSAASVVMHHHQRCDGSGYTGGQQPPLDGQRIHVFSRIVAVADTFDRLLNPTGSEAAAAPPVAALQAMLGAPMLAMFDPQVIRALIAVVPPYPPGSVVRLNDDRWAVVVDHNRDDPCYPRVQIMTQPHLLEPDSSFDGEQIDLANQQFKHLYADEYAGHEVGHLNFDVPSLSREGFVDVMLV